MLRRRSARRLLDGCAPFGQGHDPLVTLLAQAGGPTEPRELDGEADALDAFRSAVATRARARCAPAPPLGRPSQLPTIQAPEADQPLSALPIIGSIVGVAATAAIGVFALSATSVGPDWTHPVERSPYGNSVPAQPISGPAVPGSAGPAPAAGQPASRGAVRLPRGRTSSVPAGQVAVGDVVPGTGPGSSQSGTQGGAQAGAQGGEQSIASVHSARPVPSSVLSPSPSSSSADSPTLAPVLAPTPDPGPDPSLGPTRGQKLTQKVIQNPSAPNSGAGAVAPVSGSAGVASGAQGTSVTATGSATSAAPPAAP